MPYNRFEPINSLCISPILPYYASLEESELRPNRKNVACHTNLVVSNLVPPSTRNLYSLSTATSKEHKLNKPTRGSSSSNCKQNITTGGLDHIRETILKKGVSETSAKLITSTRQKIQSQITNRPGECGLADVINNRLMGFDVM